MKKLGEGPPPITVFDVRETDKAQEMVEKIIAEHGKIDIFGKQRGKPLQKIC